MFKTGAVGDSMGGSGTIRGSAGRDAIANGAQTHSVVFALPKANTNYEPIVNIANFLDSQPIFLQWYISSILTTGFTVVFNAPTDSANYLLCWEAVDDV